MRNPLKHFSFIKIAGLIAIINGIIVVAGWLYDIELFRTVLPGLVSMKFNTAIGVILCGLICFLFERPSLSPYTVALNFLLGLGAFVTLLQNIFGFDAHIDQFFVQDQVDIALGVMSPGRMSSISAICFICLCCSALLLKNNNLPQKLIGQFSAHLVTLVSLITLLGYIFKVPAFYKLSYFSSVALNTSGMLFILSLGLSSYNKSLGISSIFSGPTLGSRMARKIFPQMIALVSILGSLRIYTHQHHWVSVEFGIALFATSFLLISLLMIGAAAFELNKVDQRRNSAEHQLKEMNNSLESIIKDRTTNLQLTTERLQLAAKSALIGIWDWNLITNKVSCDDIMHTMFELRTNDHTDMYATWESRIHPEDIDDLNNAMKNTIDNDEKLQLEVRLLFSDGRIRHVRINGILKHNADGQPSHIVGISRDISVEKEQFLAIQNKEEKLKRAFDEIRILLDSSNEYQLRLQSILDNTPMVIQAKDIDGKILLVNSSYEDLYHKKRDHVIGKTDFEIFDRITAARKQKADQLVINIKEHVETEEKIIVNNREKHLMVIRFPLLNKENVLYGVGKIAADITEKVNDRQKMVDARKKAEAAEATQEQFLANMSHEIRTPLNGIVGMTSILKRTNLNDEQKEFVDIIQQSSENLQGLINDILDFSKIKAGKLIVEKIPLHPEEMIRNICAPFKIKAKEKHIDFNIVMLRKLPFTILGDQLRLSQVVNNLLSNALKFTASGVVEVAVDFSERNTGLIDLKISVIDTGIGIDKVKIDKIFETFTQASADTSRHYGGTGLGLAITKNLVELMGGNIKVESTKGIGSTFSIEIPLEVVASEMEINKQMPIVSVEGLKGKKILVAEDNLINQKVIQHILTSAGIITIIANNGREAIDIIRQTGDIDLVLMDLQMPEMDGIQATVYIRKKLNNHVPIIALTANTLRNEQIKTIEAGMNAFLSKPIFENALFRHLSLFLDNNSEKVPVDIQAKFTSDSELYDLSYITTKYGKNFAIETIRLTLATSKEALEELRVAVEEESWENTARIAHKIRGGLLILQAGTICNLLKEIEWAALEQEHTENIMTLLNKIIENFDTVTPMLENELLALS